MYEMLKNNCSVFYQYLTKIFVSPQFERHPREGVDGAVGEPTLRLQGVRDRPRAAVRGHVGATRARRAPRPHTGRGQVGRRLQEAPLLLV